MPYLLNVRMSLRCPARSRRPAGWHRSTPVAVSRRGRISGCARGRCPHRRALCLADAWSTVRSNVRITGCVLARKAVFNPHAACSRAEARHYPVRERYGDSGRRSATRIGYAASRIRLSRSASELHERALHTHANYQLSVANLLDLSHLYQYHPETLGSEQMASGAVLRRSRATRCRCVAR